MSAIVKLMAAAAACGMGGLAWAAPADDALCILEPVSAGDRLVIVEQLLRDGMAEPTVLEGEVHERYMARVLSCAERFGWNDEQASTSSAYAASLIVRDELRGRLSAAGVNVAYLDGWLVRQSDTFRTSAFLDMPVQELEEALATLPAAELSADAFEANAQSITVYLASRVHIERSERAHTLQPRP